MNHDINGVSLFSKEASSKTLNVINICMTSYLKEIGQIMCI